MVAIDTFRIPVAVESPVFSTRVGGKSVVLIDIEAAAAAPEIPPSTTLVSPAADSVLAATTPIVMDVTDSDGSFTRILVVVTLAPSPNAGQALLVHDGDGFLPGFRNFSSRITIANGFRYSIRKDLGWTTSIAVDIFAFDDTGNEAS